MRISKGVVRSYNILIDVELISPIAIKEKLRFVIREGGRTVGSGVVAKISD